MPASFPWTPALTALLGLHAAGCYAGTVGGIYAPEAPAPPQPPQAPPAAAAALESRVIPLRFVVLTHCDGCRDCRRSCRPGPSQDRFTDSVNAANEVFAPAGVRFTIGSIDRVESADWWSHGAPPVDRRFREIVGQALRIFPWMPQRGWADPDTVKATDAWIHVLTAAYSRPHEITIYVQAGHTKAGTEFPEEGRGMWTSDGTFGSVRGGPLFLFAHELGHYFGLRHTWGHAGLDPRTGGDLRLADRWDLVYHPGSGPDDPHRYFASREEAAAWSDGDLRLIQKGAEKESNCQGQPDGGVVCTLPGRGGYTETLRCGDDGLKGLCGPARSGSRFRWARNALDYDDMQIPRRLSASQVELVRVFLQHPIVLESKMRRRWGYPDGIGTLPSYRTTLGKEAPPQPTTTPGSDGRRPPAPGAEPEEMD